MRLARTGLALLLPPLAAPAWAIEVDGRIDPAEWRARSTSPISGSPSRRPARAPAQPVEAWILSTPEGLAIAAGVHARRAAQPAAVQRDFSAGRQGQRQHRFRRRRAVAYNFCISSTDGIADGVFTNENRSPATGTATGSTPSRRTRDGWAAEALIPWYIAPMRAGADGSAG